MVPDKSDYRYSHHSYYYYNDVPGDCMTESFKEEYSSSPKSKKHNMQRLWKYKKFL